MFDIIFLGSDKDKQYQKLKSKFPTAKNVLDFSEIKIFLLLRCIG